jgi:hypothetical protein
MSRSEERSQRSKVKSRLEVNGAGGRAALDSSTFDFRPLTFLSSAARPSAVTKPDENSPLAPLGERGQGVRGSLKACQENKKLRSCNAVRAFGSAAFRHGNLGQARQRERGRAKKYHAMSVNNRKHSTYLKTKLNEPKNEPNLLERSNCRGGPLWPFPFWGAREHRKASGMLLALRRPAACAFRARGSTKGQKKTACARKLLKTKRH